MAQFEMTKTDKRKWQVNLLVFALFPVTIYLGQVQALLGEQGFSADIFIPSQFTLGLITSYVIASTIDFIKKFISDNS